MKSMKSKSPSSRVAAVPPKEPGAHARKPRVRKVSSIAPEGDRSHDTITRTLLTELIARRAYELFLEEGGQHGRDIEHWLAAERELLLRA
jgi:hypothetical protein